MPDRFKQDMYVTFDNLVASGMDENSALAVALSLEIQLMQKWFASEPDAQNWLSLLRGFGQDYAAFLNRWSSFFPPMEF
jgi:hypothetical protein